GIDVEGRGGCLAPWWLDWPHLNGDRGPDAMVSSPPMVRASLSRRKAFRTIAAAVASIIPIPPVAVAATKPTVIALRRGMNLWPWFSLTREFPPPRIDYDWPPYEEARAIPGRRDLEALRKSGIDFVRIPVDPGPFLAFSGERHADLKARVNTALEMT